MSHLIRKEVGCHTRRRCVGVGWGWGWGCREGVKPHNGQLGPENRPKAFHKPAMRSANDVILVQNGLESHQKWSLQQVALTSALLLTTVDSIPTAPTCLYSTWHLLKILPVVFFIFHRCYIWSPWTRLHIPRIYNLVNLWISLLFEFPSFNKHSTRTMSPTLAECCIGVQRVHRRSHTSADTKVSRNIFSRPKMQMIT